MAEKCWVLLNDNAGDSKSTSANGSDFGPLASSFPGNLGPRYTDKYHTRPIPQIPELNKFTFDYADAACTLTGGYVNTSGISQSRLWTYDVLDNNCYFADTLPHEGPDIGMGNNTFIVGCEVGIKDRYAITDWPSGTYCNSKNSTQGGCIYTNLTLNQYSYEYTASSEASSFQKTPIKTFRLVDEFGQLIGISNNTTQAETGIAVGKSMLGSTFMAGNNGFGASIGYASDNVVLVDDRAGNIYYVRLDEYWGGTSVFSCENGTDTPHPNNPYGYTDLSININHSNPGNTFDSGYGLDEAWATCSHETDYKVYTVIARKIIDLNYPFLNGASTSGLDNYKKQVKTQGDLTFIASDPSEAGQPTVAVTVNNFSSAMGPMPSGKSLIKYVVDLDNFVVNVTPCAQQLPVGTQIIGDQETPDMSIAIVKEPTTDFYYLIANKQRYQAGITEPVTTLPFMDVYTPIHVNTSAPPSEVQYYFWLQSGGVSPYQSTFKWQAAQTTAYDCAQFELQFRGGSQPPDCVYPDSYTYNCTVNGCQSVFSSTTIPAGQFDTLSACTGVCMSYSCNSVTYGCLELPGTGQTGTFVESDDCDELCLPPYWLCGENGCITGTPTNFTYTSLTECQQAPCETWNCTPNGCFPQIGSGGTYSTMPICTASCYSYEITCAGPDPICEPYNVPYYGTGGTFTGASIAAAYTACTAATATTPCVSWVCNETTVAENTDIYVYYDTTSMSFTNTTTAHDAMMQWTTTIPGWTGNIYHIPINNERWLGWAGIPFQQPTPYGLRTTSSQAPYGPWTTSNAPRWVKVVCWGQSQPNGANWYDNMDPAAFPTGMNISNTGGGINAGTYQFRGWPPYAGGSTISPDYSVPVLNVIFADESDSYLYGNSCCPNEFGNTGIYYDVDRTSPGPSTPTFAATSEVEPTPPFQSDYNRWISIWSNIQSNNGNVATFVYPTKPVNYTSWGSGTQMVFKHMALSVLATISSGNMDQYLQPNGTPYALNGLWSAGTAPRMSSAGGASGSVPGLCSIANLTELETINPYWNSGFGGLDQYGFGTNVEFPTYTFTQFQTDLNAFVQGGTVSVATGCTSAATSVSAAYPYSSQTECLDVCDPRWLCTPTGCELNSTGGTYESLSACTASCQSWSCTTVGCDLYNSPDFGTGGTYTALLDCQTGCTSWNCSEIPPNLMFSTNGCVEYIGTGQTFSAESACTATCVSWDCTVLTPCTEYPNTAHTYSTENDCTGATECSWYQCQLGGCIQQSGQFQSGPNNYQTEQLCKDVCFGWGCIQNNISNDTNIYAFYDTSSLTLSCVQNAYNSLTAWINTIPGHTGNTYHVAIDDERWLDWGNIVYSGQAAAGLQTPNYLNNLQSLQVIQWAATTAQASNWYDNQVAATQAVPPFGLLTTKGLPPTTSVTGKTLIINFIDESDGVAYIDNGDGRYHGGSGIVGVSPPFSGGSNISHYQPTSGWTKDYTAWTSTYDAVVASGGTTQGFVYPIECNQTQMNSKRTFALQVVASITAGDQPTPNGTFSATTYPRTTASGGIQGGVPPLCGISDLQMLSVTNPYYSAGTGNLAAKGWGYNIDFLPFNSVQFQNDLGAFLTQTNTSATPGQCVSAETLWNQSLVYPYSCETCTSINQSCCSCNCAPPQQLYACTDTGCTLSVLGTMTWDQCNNPNFEYGCISWSCTTNTGCEQYNYPNSFTTLSAPTGSLYPNPLGGTGGTFTIQSDCYRKCISYNCETYNQSYGTLSTWNGCISQVGTGGTYYNTLSQTLGYEASYSACTADCKSWECDNPCGTVSYPTPIVTPAAPPLNPNTGCTEYPNTGATHLTEISCTASCEEHWYCYTGDGQTWLNNCLNASSTGVISSTAQGQITAIANNSTWQTTQFGNLRWDMTGNYYSPSPSYNNPNLTPILPLPGCQPPNFPCPCEATAGHWARIISVSHSLAGFVSYYSWQTFIDALNTSPSVSPPLTYGSVWQDVINNAGPHAHIDWEWCTCYTEECKIGCVDELPLPPQTHGSYTSSTAATEVCCTGATATTWSCQTTTQANTCDGLTLIPSIYPTTDIAYDYLAINNPTNTFSNYQYESTAPPVGTDGCAGPNGGQLWKLTGITLNNSSIQSTNYTSWSSFITALQSIPAPDGPVLGLISGMPAAAIETQIQSYSAFCSSYIEYGKTKCLCSNTPCNCVELLDGSGPYTSQTECQLTCCESGTSWNCQNGFSFAPICGDRDYIGMYNDNYNAIEHWRVNSANTQFGLSKVIITTPVVPGFNPLTWAQVQVNMGVAWNWQDCYYNLPGTQDYWPYQYISNISHPDVNGGQTYNTWQTFSGAVTTAGVSFNSTDSVLTVCNKIDTQIGGTGIGCIIETNPCCNGKSCYCYEIFSGGGTYTTQQICQPLCCPPPPMGWECTPPQFPATIGTCLYVPCTPSPTCHSTWSDCITNCTGETSWNCVPGQQQEVGIDSVNCDASKTYINPGVPMSQGQALEFALLNYATTNFNTMYNLNNTSFGIGTNYCVDPLTGYFFRTNVRPTWYTPGGIYDAIAGNVGGTNWADALDYLNTTYQALGNGSQTTTNPFFVGMTLSDVEQMMRDTDPNWGITWDTAAAGWSGIGIVSTSCGCIVTPCDCVEVSGNQGQYPTYASCIPPCCQVPDDTYDCTINGCIDPGGGYGQFQGATALQDCQDVCWEWACNPTSSVSSNCQNLTKLHFYGNLQYIYGGGNGTGSYKNLLPRTNVKLGNAWVNGASVPQNTGPYNGSLPGTQPHNIGCAHWAQSSQIGNVLIDFFGNPGGSDSVGVTKQAPPYDNYNNQNYPPGVRWNYQNVQPKFFMMDTTIIGPESQLTGTTTSPLTSYCDSPHGKWWRPTAFGVVHKTTGAVIIGGHTTYADLIKAIDIQQPTVLTALGISTTAPVANRIMDLLDKQPYELNAALDTAVSGFGTLEGVLKLYGEPCLC